MKQNILKILFLGYMVIIYSCQKDDSFITNKQKAFQQNTLQAEDVPYIINYLKQETNGTLKVKVDNKKIIKANASLLNSERTEQTVLGYIDTERVLQLQEQNTGNSKYTFSVTDNDLKTFINLIVVEDFNELSSYFVKYKPSEAWIDERKDLNEFTGSIELYNYSGNLINTINLNNGFVTEYSSRISPCVNPDTYTDNSTSNTSNPSGGGSISPPADNNPIVFSSWIPSGGTTGGSNGQDSTIDQNEEEEDEVDGCDGPQAQTGHCDGPNGDGDCYCHLLGNRMAQMDLQIIDPTQTTGSEPENNDDDCVDIGVLLNIGIQINLTQVQIDWLTHIDNFDTYLAVFTFLEENENSEESEGFVNEIINLMMADSSLTFNEALLQVGFVNIDAGQPKVDPAEELNCFDLTQGAKLTVYVQQPWENSDAVVGPNEVGHAFIGIEQGGIVRQVGYYPDIDASNVEIGNDYEAAIRTNYNYLFHVSISLDISSTQLTDIVNHTINFPPTYNTNNYACVDFAIAIGNLGGMNLPSTTVTTVLSNQFSGRSPGQFGQEIRAMNSTTETHITTTSSNSASKQGTCE